LGLDKHQAKNQKSIVKETYNFVPLMALLKLINNQDHLVIFDVDDVLRHLHRHKLLQLILNLINPQEIELLKSNIFLNTK